MPFRAILFDLDGTLLDTLRDIAAAANEALTLEGFPTHTEAEYLHFIGDGIGMLIRRAIPPDQGQAEVDRCLEQFQTAYHRGWNVHTRFYPGIPELLDALVGRSLALAVLSNKADEFTQKYGEEYLSRWPFRAIMGHRSGTAKKPDPASALEIAATLGVEPADCLFVGDSVVDVQTGHAAGMFPVGVSWGFQSVESLKEARPSAIIDRPLGVLAVLDRGQGD